MRPTLPFEEEPRSGRKRLSAVPRRPHVQNYVPTDYYQEGHEEPKKDPSYNRPPPSKINLPHVNDRRYFHIYPGGVGAPIHGGGLDNSGRQVPQIRYDSSPKDTGFKEQSRTPSRAEESNYSQEKIDDDNLLSSSNEESVQDLEEDMSAEEPQTSSLDSQASTVEENSAEETDAFSEDDEQPPAE